ncbi:MAG: hypothetical protein B6D41_14455 [Chloroflexi bacterium UTCFX4]|jgi:dTDP-glucose pyrophosphorylase/CBS domain-containing protein|nr:MAG: hypothetical protein B6D41_14455 [Chloroflexi bacterium UTCFX4]
MPSTGLSREEPAARLRRVVIPPDLTVNAAISLLDRAGVGVLLVCDGDGKLLATLTDGDIRRALLRGIQLDTDALSVANQEPIMARLPLTLTQALHWMDHGKKYVVNHLPVVDEQGRPIELLLRSDLMAELPIPLSAVIMAGGFGTRLRPLTENLPKPMLPVGDRPLLELTIEQLRRAGIHNVNITTHYKPEKIIAHFGNGENFGIHITYVTEDRPLGTAGGLRLLENNPEPLLVINGDILTRIDFRAMLDFHRAHHAQLTAAVRQFKVQVPYGIMQVDGPFVRGITEKPLLSFLTNAGIYLLEPQALQLIPNEIRFDMTDLIQRLLEQNKTVVSFPIIEYWLDIGQYADYMRAQEDVKQGVFADSAYTRNTA